MRQLGRLTAIVVVVIAATFAGTARAGGLLGGGCGSTSPVFSAWGDPSDYYFAGNGGFENGTSGWSVSNGAQVVADNETAHVHSSGDSHALAVPAGGSASISVCYGLTYPALRFFVKGSGATVHVSVTTRNLLGILSTLDGGTFQAGSDWAPSPKLSTLLSALVAPLGAQSMTLHIDVSGAPAEIDDLYVDPLLMRT